MNLVEQIKVNDVSIDGYHGTYYSENQEYIQVITDSEEKILEGIKSDGSKYITGDLTIYGSINSNSLKNLISEQIDKSLEPIEDTLSYFNPLENPEWILITTDTSNRILSGRKTDGILYENKGIETLNLISDNVTTNNITANIITADILNLSPEGIEKLNIKNTVYIYNKTAKIDSGNYRNTTSFATAPALECQVYGKVLIKGFDAFISFREDVSWKTISEIPFVEDGVETEILIPTNVKYIIVGTASKTPVAQDTYFDFTLSYDADDLKKTKDIIELRNRNKYLPVLQSLNLTANGAGNKPSVTYKPLVLMTLTDIHDNHQGTRAFFNFYNQYKSYLTDVIALGDYQNGALNIQISIDKYDGWHDMLKVIGNHDAYHSWDGERGTYDYIVDESVCYDTFMAGHIQNWGVVYQEGKTYFYKDYDDAKIRVIFIDYMHWDEDNDTDGLKSWLQNILYGQNNEDSAAVKNYHVVVCLHTHPKSPLSGIMVPFDNCSFNYFDGDLSQKGYFMSSMPDIINTFQSSPYNGNFICYLCGHRHVDFTGTFENYTNQIIINQACTAAFEYARDSVYTWDTDYCNQFNIYSFDSEKKLIRVYRVGANYNRNMQHKESMLIQYGSTVKLLSCF